MPSTDALAILGKLVEHFEAGRGPHDPVELGDPTAGPVQPEPSEGSVLPLNSAVIAMPSNLQDAPAMSAEFPNQRIDRAGFYSVPADVSFQVHAEKDNSLRQGNVFLVDAASGEVLKRCTFAIGGDTKFFYRGDHGAPVALVVSTDSGKGRVHLRARFG